MKWQVKKLIIIDFLFVLSMQLLSFEEQNEFTTILINNNFHLHNLEHKLKH